MAARAFDNTITDTIRQVITTEIHRYLFLKHLQQYNENGNKAADNAEIPAGLSNDPVMRNEPL